MDGREATHKGWNMKRRRLSDAYKTGVPVTIDDGAGEPIEVWLQKISPVDHESALRKASAARAKHLIATRDDTTDEYQATWADVDAFPDPKVLVDLLVNERLQEKRAALESEIAAEEEWADDSYLQGMFDAWNEELKDRYAVDHDDPEAVRVHSELRRFNEQVDERFEETKADIENEYAGVPNDQLVREATHYFLERRAASVFIKEYERYQIFYAVREPDNHRSYYFKDGVGEVDELAEEVRAQVIASYQAMSVDPIEGKGLAGTPPSSNSSEPSDPEETEASSGLSIVSA